MARSIQLPLTEQQEEPLHYFIQSIDESGFPTDLCDNITNSDQFSLIETKT